jgi:colanic acid biosynthesis glycosyl transferase WcaI
MRERLVEKARSAQLTNLQFYPLQSYDRLPDLMALANVHLVLQRRGAADLVLPSKLTSIFAAGGHALITADHDTELGRICAENPGIAYLCDPENPSQFIELLGKMLHKPDIRSRRPNRAARAYAEQHLEMDKVLSTFFDAVLDDE